MKKKLWFHLLTVVLIVMLVAALSVNALADDDPGVAVSKEISVLENGTYELDLEAFATGTVTTTTVVKPCDLVLVLDASSSMGQTGSSYLMSDGTVRIQALVDAVNSFLETVAEKNAENAAAGSDLSKVAIVVFSDSSHTGTLYNFTEITESNLAANSVYSTYSNRTYTTTGYGTSGKGFALNNYTWTDSGLSQANTLLSNLTAQSGYDKNGRNRVVVLFTDGYPNHSGGLDNFDTEAARSVINTAGTIKSTHQASVFTIAVLGGTTAQPGRDPQNTSQSTYGGQNQMRVNQMLHAASSNYPQASVAATWNVTWGSGGNYQGGYYKSASSASDLKNIFTDIAESSASSSTPLTAESVMKDIVASSFTLPEGADVDTIEVAIVPWDMTNHRWAGTWDMETNNWSGTVYSPEQWKTACQNYGASAAENVAIALSEDGKTIDVTGFDYGTHFVPSTDPTSDNLNMNSAKVVIHFPIQAKPSAVTGGEVATNGPESGIYLDGNATEPYIAFPQPKVQFTPVTYVVDYVTSDTTHDTKVSTVKLDYSGVLSNVQMLDDPSDDYLIGEEAVDFDYTIYKGQYGTISFGDDEVDVQRRYVRYAPTTMNWDGYDRIFVKGASKDDNDLSVWAMLCVIPANSVFYEDTYITQTKTVTYNDETVKIEYTGINYDKSWDTVGTEGKNSTQHAGDEMGWVEGLADDYGYANDMAHIANTAKAKATFTFTGTGVDIYSRTNGTTGTVTVKIQGVKDPETGKRYSKMKAIDTKAAAGDFFAIPVCTFTDLPYGEYTVTITVTTGGQNEGRLTFYLDGVRVYNPIQPLEVEENVQNMYGEKNLGAVFTEVRSMLLDDPALAEAQAVYIDEHYTEEEVEDVDAIEAAAKDLADAQAARDAYVEETITPAKNAVSEAEYALSSAKDAATNATNIYNAAVKALNDAQTAGASEEEIAALQAVVDKANSDLTAANEALAAAQAEYDANIGGLNAALESAIAGRADYDDAIEAARTAYQTASGNVIVIGYTTNDIALYEKEGPKSEVLLDKGQQVVISVEPGKTYYVGLRSLFGEEVTAKIGSESVTLSHTVDLYYEADGSSGKIVVKNDGSDGILSVTKLRTTGVGNETSGTKFASTEEMLAYAVGIADVYDAYNGDVMTEEEAYAEEPVVETPAEEPEVVELDESEISIENPVVSSGTGYAGNTGRRTSSISSMPGMINSFKGFVRH